MYAFSKARSNQSNSKSKHAIDILHSSAIAWPMFPLYNVIKCTKLNWIFVSPSSRDSTDAYLTNNNFKAKQKLFSPHRSKDWGNIAIHFQFSQETALWLRWWAILHVHVYFCSLFRLEIIQTLCPEWVQWSDLISAGNREWLARPGEQHSSHQQWQKLRRKTGHLKWTRDQSPDN